MAVVNLTLVTNGAKKKDQVPDSMTVRQIYERYGVNYGMCSNTIDSVPLQIGQLDKTLAELGCGEEVRMSSIVKADNAAQAVVAGSAVVIRSKYKLDEWKTALKFDPDYGIYDEEGDPVFKVFISKGPGCLSNNGIEWADIPDKDGYAIVTVIIDPKEEDKEGFVKEKLGLALLRLRDVEEDLENVIKEAKENQQEIDEMVSSI